MGPRPAAVEAERQGVLSAKSPINRALIGILFAGALLRGLLLLWFAGEPVHVADAKEYNTIAVNLATRGDFSASPSGELTSIRPPLYPFFVSVIYRVAGIENYQAVRAVQSVLGLVLVVVVYRLAASVFSSRAANWAAALCCFYPSLLLSNFLLLTETLFTLLLCLACTAVGRGLRSNAIVWMAVFGVLVGLAALTRSVLWLFPPFFAVYLLFAVRGVGFGRRLALALVPVLTFAATIAPWSVRNTRLHETFTTIDVMGGRNAMMGNYEHTPLTRAWDAISINGDRSWYAVLAREEPGFAEMTQGQRDRAAMRRAIRYIVEHPWLTLQRDAVKFFNFWQLERAEVAGFARGWWGNLPRPAVLGLAVVFLGSYAIVLVSGVFGFCTLPSGNRQMHWFLLLVVAYVCALHSGVFGHSRYHVPLMPLVMVYSANAWLHSGQIWRGRGRWPFWIAVFVSATLAASWVWEALVVDSARVRELLFS